MYPIRLWLFVSAIVLELAMVEAVVLFHGTSIVIRPSNETSSPSQATYYAANFFCYMAEEGYLSFGWWVPATSHGNTSHCLPDSDRYHWYEYSHRTASDADSGTFDYKTQNVQVRLPTTVEPFPFPSQALNYHIRALSLGNGNYGDMAVSYIDDGEVGFHAVGTRQTLSGATDWRDVGQCEKALRTLLAVSEKYKLGERLTFQLDQSVCHGTSPSGPIPDLAVSGQAPQARLYELA